MIDPNAVVAQEILPLYLKFTESDELGKKLEFQTKINAIIQRAFKNLKDPRFTYIKTIQTGMEEQINTLLSGKESSEPAFPRAPTEKDAIREDLDPKIMAYMPPRGIVNGSIEKSGKQHLAGNCWAVCLLRLIANSSSISRKILESEGNPLLKRQLQIYLDAKIKASPFAECLDIQKVRESDPSIPQNSKTQLDPADDLLHGLLDGMKSQISLSQELHYLDETGNTVKITRNNKMHESYLDLDLISSELDFDKAVQSYFVTTFSSDAMVNLGGYQVQSHAKRKCLKITPPKDLIIRAKRHKQVGFIKRGSEGRIEEKKIVGDLKNIPLENPIPREFLDADAEYQLRTCIIHYGNSPRSGHYVTLERKPDNSWYYCNDHLIFEWKEELGQWFSRNENKLLPKDALAPPTELLKQGYLFQYERTNESRDHIRSESRRAAPAAAASRASEDLQKDLALAMELDFLLNGDAEQAASAPAAAAVESAEISPGDLQQLLNNVPAAVGDAPDQPSLLSNRVVEQQEPVARQDKTCNEIATDRLKSIITAPFRALASYLFSSDG